MPQQPVIDDTDADARLDAVLREMMTAVPKGIATAVEQIMRHDDRESAPLVAAREALSALFDPVDCLAEYVTLSLDHFEAMRRANRDGAPH